MTALTRFSLRFRTVVLLLVGLSIALGASSLTRLDRELFPPVDPPYLVVSAALPGASPDQVATSLTQPLEDAAEAGAGVEHVQSSSQEGFAVVFVEYAYGTDLDERRGELLDELAELDLPSGASDPEVQSVSPNDLPIYAVAVTGPEAAVRDFTNDDLVPDLQAVTGVADAVAAGAAALVVSVELDPQALADNGVTIAGVVEALDAAATSAPVGRLTDEDTDTPLRVVGDVEDVADVVVAVGEFDADAAEEDQAEGAAQPVRVGDLGQVDPSRAPTPETISRLDGEPAAVVQVLKDSDANTVTVVEDLEEVLDDLARPSGVRVTTITDQAPQIRSGVSEVAREALIGAGLALVMILVFLRSGRGTLVAGVAIPLSLLVGAALMEVTGISLNILTLGALAVAAGRVIDDSIVVLENIYRNLELGLPRARAVWQGTREVAGAVTTATLAAAAVFLPLAFISGLAGEVFIGFALTTAFALAASLLVSLTVVPVLASLLLGRAQAEQARVEDSPLRRIMASVITWALDHRAAVLALIALATGGSAATLLAVPVNLFPSTDPQNVEIAVDLPTGASLERSGVLLEALETEVAQVDGVRNAALRIGTVTEGGGLLLAASGSGDASVVVALEDEVDVDQLVDDLTDAVAATGLTGRVVEQQIIPGGADVSAQVTGENFDEVTEAASEVFDELTALDGIDNVSSNLADSGTELSIEVDADEAAARGLDAATVTQLLQLGLSDRAVGSLDVQGTETDLVVRFAPDAVADADALRSLPLVPGVTVAEVAEVVEVDAATGITRWDGTRSAEVTAVITDANIGGATTRLDQALDDLELSGDVEVQQVGTSSEVTEVVGDMVLAMGIAVVLTYLILVASFGSLVIPLIVLVALPLAAVGAFPALALTGRELGLPALIGLLMLIGIVVTNAIVLLQFVQQLRADGMSTREALVQGTQIRVRPILMTALTTILGLVPLSLGLSDGALLSASLATVVIGGLVSSTALTLVVIPVVYSLVDPDLAGGRYPDVFDGDGPAVAVGGPPGVPTDLVPVRRAADRAEAERLRDQLVATGFAADRIVVRELRADDNGWAERPRPGVRGLADRLRRRNGHRPVAGEGPYAVLVPADLAPAVQVVLTSA